MLACALALRQVRKAWWTGIWWTGIWWTGSYGKLTMANWHMANWPVINPFLSNQDNSIALFNNLLRGAFNNIVLRTDYSNTIFFNLLKCALRIFSWKAHCFWQGITCSFLATLGQRLAGAAEVWTLDWTRRDLNPGLSDSQHDAMTTRPWRPCPSSVTSKGL